MMISGSVSRRTRVKEGQRVDIQEPSEVKCGILKPPDEFLLTSKGPNQ